MYACCFFILLCQRKQHTSAITSATLPFQPREIQINNMMLHTRLYMLLLPSSCFLKGNTWRHLSCFCYFCLPWGLGLFWRGISRKILALFTSCEGSVYSDEAFLGRFLLPLPPTKVPPLLARRSSTTWSLRVPTSGAWMSHKARWELAHTSAFMPTDT